MPVCWRFQSSCVLEADVRYLQQVSVQCSVGHCLRAGGYSGLSTFAPHAGSARIFPRWKTASFPQPVESRGAAATFAQRPTILVQTLVQRKIGVAVASRHCAGTRPRPPGPLVFVRQVRVSACLCLGSLWEGRCSDLRRGLCVSSLRSGHAYLVVCACHPCAVATLISWFVPVTLAQFCGSPLDSMVTGADVCWLASLTSTLLKLCGLHQLTITMLATCFRPHTVDRS